MSRKLLNFRRCHVCGATNESSGEEKISKCNGCGRTFAPFFYFEVSDIKGYSADTFKKKVSSNYNDIYNEKELQLLKLAEQTLKIVKEMNAEMSGQTNYKPLNGLAVVW